MCVHTLANSSRKVKPKKCDGVLANHCSGQSQYSHKPGPELKINERLQSSQLSPIFKHSDNTSTLSIPVEKKGTTQKKCASKSHVNHKVKKKTENKQNDNVLRVIRMHDNMQAAE